jgi:RNA polymerase sigma factor (sigma-70 family)
MSPAPLAPPLVARAYERARAALWGLDLAAFSRVLETSVARASAQDGPGFNPDRYVDALHLDELALAAACAAGHERAWDHFVREYRQALYRAAAAIDADNGRELADSLYAELFGLTEHNGERRSLFRYFDGRSKLATWLRAVLAQRHVDGLRARRRLTSLPEDDGLPAAPPAPSAAPEHARFARIIELVFAAAVSALPDRDRLRLSLYYVRDLTLAQIGRLLGEHEGTVSRHLTRTRRDLRAAMEIGLRDDHGLDQAGIDDCFRAVLDDAGPLDLARAIGVASGGRQE